MWDLKSLAQTLKRTRQYFYYRKYSLFINNYKHQNSLICYSGINSGYIQQVKLILLRDITKIQLFVPGEHNENKL